MYETFFVIKWIKSICSNICSNLVWIITATVPEPEWMLIPENPDHGQIRVCQECQDFQEIDDDDRESSVMIEYR